LKIIREAELKTDTSGVDALLGEKAQIATDVAKAEQLVSTAENELRIAKARMTALNNETTSLLATRNDIWSEFKGVDPKSGVDVKCPKCKFEFNPNRDEETAKHKARLDDIEKRGDEIKLKIDANKKLVVALSDNIQLLTAALVTSKLDWKTIQAGASTRIKEIDEAIKTRPTTPPEQDEAWQNIVAEIAKVEKEIGPPVAEQLEAIESERTTKDAELNKLNEEMAQADRMVKDRARITELEAKEKGLAQLIADIEKQLADIERYKATQNTMITAAVNTKFTAVRFKMFKELLNGGLEECCEATLQGVPYADMSKGESIYVGLGISNVLSEHYGFSVPLFMDNAESYGMSLESNSQTIRLKFVKGVKELQVETVEKKEKAVA
jgi:DNA repair exonuclease SbcCD ATPase subunit